jgi:hypothetical protein
MKQIPVDVVEPHHLPQLLQGPRCTRARRDIDARQSAATVLNDHEYIEQAEGRVDRNEEVARHKRFRMALQER